MATIPQMLITTKRPPIEVYIQAPDLTIQKDGNTIDAVNFDLQLTDIGDEFYNYPQSRICEAFGKRFLLFRGTIRERDTGGSGSWGIVHSFSPSLNANNWKSGLHSVFANGEETICCIYQDSSGAFNVVSSTDGVTWSTQNIYNVPGTSRSVGISTVFGSSLVWALYYDTSSTDIALMVYDFNSSALTTIPVPSGIGIYDIGSASLLVYRNKLFICFQRSGVTFSPLRIYRLDNSALTLVYESTAHTNPLSAGNEVIYNAMFEDPATNDLILIGLQNANGSNPASDLGLFAVRISNANVASNLNDSSADVTDLTSTVIPSALLSQSLGGSHAQSVPSIVGVVVDSSTTPGVVTPFITVANGKLDGFAGNWEWYEWVSTNNQMVLRGSSTISASTYIIGSFTYGLTTRIPSIGTARLVFDGGSSVEVNDNAVKVFFRVYGTGQQFNFGFYIGDSSAPDRRINLVASSVNVESGTPPTVPTNTSSQLLGVTPDNGATLYSIHISFSGTSIGSDAGYFLMAVPE